MNRSPPTYNWGLRPITWIIIVFFTFLVIPTLVFSILTFARGESKKTVYIYDCPSSSAPPAEVAPPACPESSHCDECPNWGVPVIRENIVISNTDGDEWLASVPYENYDLVQTVSDKILCVDAAYPLKGDGSCWNKPFKSLQDALEQARNKPGKYCAIWVARGTYRPSKTYTPSGVKGGAFAANPQFPPETDLLNGTVVPYPDDIAGYDEKLKTFQLVDNVAIYGGFYGKYRPGGGETSTSQRIRGAHETVLQGVTEQNPNQYVYHTLTGHDDIALTGVTTRLDGLTILDGDCTTGPYYPRTFCQCLDPVAPVYYHDDGGGLFVFVQSDIVIHNVEFRDNFGIAGGAIFFHDGTHMVITASKFSGCAAIQGAYINMRGVGPTTTVNMFTARPSMLDVYHSEFGQVNDFLLYDVDGPITSAPVVFAYETHIRNETRMITNIHNCYIHDISVEYGTYTDGAIAFRNSKVVISDSLGENLNVTSYNWPSFCWVSNSDLVSRGNVVRNTESLYSAFLVGSFNYPSTLVADHTTFDNNYAHYQGGAIASYGTDVLGRFHSSITIMGSTFSRNSATAGGAAWLYGNYSVHGNVFVDNVARDGSDLYGGALLLDVVQYTVPTPVREEFDNIYCGNSPNNVTVIFNNTGIVNVYSGTGDPCPYTSIFRKSNGCA